MPIPKFILKKLYKKDSFKNADLDGDGKIDGFSFVLENKLANATIVPDEKPGIKLDGVPINPDDVTIKYQGESMKLSAFNREVLFAKGTEMEIVVKYANGVPAGDHKLEFSSKSKEYGSITFDIDVKV
ncbi:MAG: DUF6379 domain-containing protein [Candidatus Korarchaeota archaeon]